MPRRQAVRGRASGVITALVQGDETTAQMHGVVAGYAHQVSHMELTVRLAVRLCHERARSVHARDVTPRNISGVPSAVVTRLEAQRHSSLAPQVLEADILATPKLNQAVACEGTC